MRPLVQSFPRPQWTPVPRAGCVNVQGRVLMRGSTLTVAQLRLGVAATIDEHAVPWDIDVLCLEGEGKISIDGEEVPICADQWVRWPANTPHRLFTTSSTMTTLMLEHTAPSVR